MNDSLADAPRRTNPLGLVPAALGQLRQAGLALVAAAFAFRDDLAQLAIPVAALVLLVATAALAFAWLAWARTTYCVGANDIRVTRGVLARDSRAVPYDRIQDVSLEQGLASRLLGLVEVRFETGAGGKDELRLAYLAADEGERLRDRVRARRLGVNPEGAAAASDAGETGTEQGRLLFALPPRRLATFGLFEFSLVAVAALGGLVEQFDFLLPFDFWDLDEWEQRLAGPGAWFVALGPAAQALGLAMALASLALVGVGTGLVRTVLREWHFRLELTPRGLRRRRGLLTRTDVTVPLHRIQGLVVATGIIRRRFGWRSLSLVTLGGEDKGGSLAVAPFARADEVAAIARETGFDLPGEGASWHSRSPAYRRDRMVAWTLLLGPLAAGLLALGQGWQALAAATGLGIVLLGHGLRWRRDRHAMGRRFFHVRTGWLKPVSFTGEYEHVQTVHLIAGPLGRRHGYCTLAIGVAGRAVGIAGMPRSEAEDWRKALLEGAGRRDFSALLLR